MKPAQINKRQPLAVIDVNKTPVPIQPVQQYVPSVSGKPNIVQFKQTAVLPSSRTSVVDKKPTVLTSVLKTPLVHQNAITLKLQKPAFQKLPVVQQTVNRDKPTSVLISTAKPFVLTSAKPAPVTSVLKTPLVHQKAKPLQLQKPAVQKLPVIQQTVNRDEPTSVLISTAKPFVLTSAKPAPVTCVRKTPLFQQKAKPLQLQLQQNKPCGKSASVTISSAEPSLSSEEPDVVDVVDVNTTENHGSNHNNVKTIQCYIPDLIESSPVKNTSKKVQDLSCSDNSLNDLQAILESTLPVNYQYKILSVDPLKVYNESLDQNGMFQAIIRLDIRNKEDALEWMQNYKMSSSTDWRVRRCFAEDTNKIIFKKQYRCHNNTLAQFRPETKKAHYKHTQCKASVTVTVKQFKMKRSKDTLLKSHPLEIIIDQCHNHPLHAADSLRHRRPNPDVKDLILGMFRSGHSPSSALRTLQYDLQVQHGDEFWKVLSDGAQCPNLQWCFNQYYKQFGEAYGAPDGSEMVASLQQAIDKYNVDCGSPCAAMKQIGGDVVIALCTPLMKRVHEHLKSSAEMTFLDSGGMMDRQNTRIFTFLASSVAGALPTGMVFTSSESQAVVLEGMSLLKTVHPPNAFYGRGDKGPLIGMTDDSTSERNCLRMTYPGMILLLCYFHILQAYWRYVLDSKHKVEEEHRLEIFFLFKAWCKCESEEEFKSLYAAQLTHPVIAKNKFLLKHLKEMNARAPEWAFCYREELLTRGNNTDNYSEITIRNYKDVLERLKAYSLVQLFDFFTTRIEAYWERRIATVVNNRTINYTRSKHFIRPEKLIPLHCTKSSLYEGIYIVKNEKSGGEYTVDTDLDICNCPVGKHGAPCKHQQAVVKQFNLSSTQFLPFDDEEAKLTLHKIMTITPPPPGWYASLKGGPCTKSIAHGQSIQDDLANDLEEVDKEDVTGAESMVVDLVDDERRAAAIDAWKSVHDSILQGLQTRPEVFLGAVEKFTQHFGRVKNLSENALLSAMHTFAKYDSPLRRKACISKGRYSNVNSESVRRRKNKVGGRKVAPQGRPPKTKFTAEHGYIEQRGKKRRAALPHCLMYRIESSTVSKKRKLS